MEDYGNDVANDDNIPLVVKDEAKSRLEQAQAMANAGGGAVGGNEKGFNYTTRKRSAKVTSDSDYGGSTQTDKLWIDSAGEGADKALEDVLRISEALQGKQKPSATLANILRPTVTETVKTSQKRQGDLKNQKTLGLIGDALRVVTDLGTAAGGGNVILHTPFDAGAKDKEIKAEEDKEVTTKTAFSNAVAQARFAEDSDKMALFKLIYPNYFQKIGSNETTNKVSLGSEKQQATEISNFGKNKTAGDTETQSNKYILPNGAVFSINDSKSREVSDAVFNSILANPELRRQAIKLAGSDIQDAFQGLLEEQGYATADAKRQATIVTAVINGNSWKEALKSVDPDKLKHIIQLYWDKDKIATQYVLNHAVTDKDNKWRVLDEAVNGSFVGRKTTAANL